MVHIPFALCLSAFSLEFFGVTVQRKHTMSRFDFSCFYRRNGVEYGLGSLKLVSFSVDILELRLLLGGDAVVKAI